MTWDKAQGEGKEKGKAPKRPAPKRDVKQQMKSLVEGQCFLNIGSATFINNINRNYPTTLSNSENDLAICAGQLNISENKMIAVLSLSGGLDSTSLLLHLLLKKYKIYTVTYNYGQKHSIEFEYAKKNIEYL